MDPDPREVATLHPTGRDAMAWPAGAIGHLRLVRRLITASEKAHMGLQNRSMIKFCIPSLV
jgi:hypothetical protein